MRDPKWDLFLPCVLSVAGAWTHLLTISLPGKLLDFVDGRYRVGALHDGRVYTSVVIPSRFSVCHVSLFRSLFGLFKGLLFSCEGLSLEERHLWSLCALLAFLCCAGDEESLILVQSKDFVELWKTV